ncbi:MAG: hypothetical protein ACYDCG_06170 [Candidatus Acidiferrales bacterium]
MSSLPLSVQLIWACSTLAQLMVLVLLFMKGNSRKVPFFTAYIALNICQAGFLLVLYSISGISSAHTVAIAWVSECITLLAQALAATEILGITLRPYPGIWGLGWRAIAVTSALVVIVVALTSHGQNVQERLFELNRGYHLTFATAFIACLLLVRYYSIRVPAAYKMILGGFCFNSCVEVLIYTFIQILFHEGFEVHQPTWQFLTTLSFVAALFIWMVALRKPFPAEDRQIASLSDSEYQRLSPEINEHLRVLNEKLLRLWKMEARQH